MKENNLSLEQNFFKVVEEEKNNLSSEYYQACLDSWNESINYGIGQSEELTDIHNFLLPSSSYFDDQMFSGNINASLYDNQQISNSTIQYQTNSYFVNNDMNNSNGTTLTPPPGLAPPGLE